MSILFRKVAMSALAASVLLASQPAMADGGAITAYVTRKTVAFVVNFLNAASSNANAAAAATAVSTAGTSFDPDQDTGFFSATASVNATSGNLARSAVSVTADYNFIDPHELTITPGDSKLITPNGLSWEWYANASIKGIWQVLLESIPSPFTAGALDAPVMGDVVVPLSFSFDLNNFTSYSFNLALEFDDASTIELAQGTAGAGGASILFPYLEDSNPGLASALRNQYLGAVDGQSGAVSLTLGEGLLPANDDGVTGLSVAVPVGQQFRLNSGLDGDAARSVPEPATWLMLVIGFGCIGFLQRRRGPQAAASPSSGIA